MKDVGQLWSSRLKSYWEIAIRYLRLIGNSGFLFTIYLLIIVGSYYYRHFLDWLPQTFPAVLFFVIVSTFLLTRGAVRTFVKEGDLVFLLPMEGRLQPYFRSSIIYSSILQNFTLIVIFFILAPIFAERINSSFSYFLVVLLILAGAKVWNLLCHFEEQRLASSRERIYHIVLRVAMNASFSFFLFVEGSWVFLLAVAVIMLGVYLIYYRKLQRNHSIKWEQLLSIENKMLTLFFRVANMFTDVPSLKSSFKKRRWANAIVTRIPYKHKHTFDYLYTRAFLRSNDYFGIYIRLIIVGTIILLVLPDGIVRYLLYFVFIYMSGLQLSTLWKHFYKAIWVDLYPIQAKDRQQSFLRLIFILLSIKATVLVALLVMFAEVNMVTLILLPLGLAFSYAYSFHWMHRKVNVR
ncbi:ABC transporter permease [Alkalihalobacterium chitinilyticum]|uniref:ABC transporter permease n=1 Tax=Alkalihalobacterium chitinilyticum TaxID=2980103 RepID=A0ABT5VHP8_9BACI|nr:ABC transporter permease [Alkalihalobacterium chitinilyticum]MDE5414982.1 ABC transporter permease [Alkalihalobacterium chitinilyticum]